MKRTLWLGCIIAVFSVVVVPTGALAHDEEEAEAAWGNANKEAREAFEKGDYALAEKHLQDAIEHAEEFGDKDVRLAVTLNNLAVLYSSQEKYEEATPLLHRAIEVWENAEGADSPKAAQGYSNLAVLYINQRKYGDAEPLYRRALAVHEKTKGPEDPLVARDLHDLAELLSEEKKYAEADSLYKRSLAIAEKAFGPDDITVGFTLENYARMLRLTDRNKEAEVLEARARSIREKLGR